MPTVSPVPADQCDVPGCPQPKIKEDCCKAHGRANGSSPTSLPNDGIIDWVAIELAADVNARLPRLSWIEREVAAALMLSRGAIPKTAERRLNINIFKRRTRERIDAMAEAITLSGGLRAVA